MKKALSFILALVITLMPMSALAAAGDPVAVPSWENCIYSGDTVTVGAGETVYFEIGTDNVSGAYDFIVEGTGDFDVAVCGESGDGAYVEGTPVSAVDGKVETTINSFDSTYCYGCFSITNNSDASADYVCTIVFPEGAYGNPKTVTVTLDESFTVTVPADPNGMGYYINLVVPAMRTDYQMTVTGAAGFSIGTGMGMPANDNGTGSVTATINAYFTEAVSLNFLNNSGAEQTYTFTVSNMPVGTPSNPEIITGNGSYTADIEADSWTGYLYNWTAPENGVAIVEMNQLTNANGWYYVVNNLSAGIYGDIHTSLDTELVPSESVAVTAGDALEIAIFTCGENNSVPAGKVNWTFTFVNYAESTTPIVTGTNDYALDANYGYTVFVFEPTETGKYTITSADSNIGIISYSTMWVQNTPSADNVASGEIVWECTGVGQGIMIAVAVNEAASASITVEKEEVVKVEIPWTEYVNQVTPESFVFEGDVDALLYVDTEDDIVDTAVLGDDGYYHLNTADGPILYVNINDSLMSLVSAMGYGQLKDINYDENGEIVEKIDYNNALNEYYLCADTDTYLYPLTVDLMAILQNVGEYQGWYGEEGWVGGVLDDAWMFACYYNEVTVPDYILGDANNDGELTAVDYMIIKQLVFSIRSVTDLEAQETAALRCDMNGDGKFTAVDYLRVKQLIFA